MPDTSDVSIVFADLQDALDSLDQARGSPKDVRRSLSRYADLSQRLTSAMRKDFSRRGLGKWDASQFNGWTADTELLKYIRNEDQHGSQICVTVQETQYYQLPDEVDVPGFTRETFVVRGTWQITDHTLATNPQGLELCLADPSTSTADREVLAPLRVKYAYVFLTRSDAELKKFSGASTQDLHEFAHNTFVVMKRYHMFYKSNTV
jgi:hypothetical protein